MKDEQNASRVPVIKQVANLIKLIESEKADNKNRDKN
jgi:hypothetical protein